MGELANGSRLRKRDRALAKVKNAVWPLAEGRFSWRGSAFRIRRSEVCGTAKVADAEAPLAKRASSKAAIADVPTTQSAQPDGGSRTDGCLQTLVRWACAHCCGLSSQAVPAALLAGEEGNNTEDLFENEVHGDAKPWAAGEEERCEQLRNRVQRGSVYEGLSVFAQDYCNEDTCRRLLRKCSGDVEQAQLKLERALVWREQHEALLAKQDFKMASDLRIVGFDAVGHPILYLCGACQLLSNKFLPEQYIVRMVQAIEMMPPGVEKLTHVWDLYGMSLRLNYSPSPFLQLKDMLDGYFAERLNRLVICDMPRGAAYLKETLWHYVPEKSKGRINFMNPGQVSSYLGRVCSKETAEHIIDIMKSNRADGRAPEERRSSWDSRPVPLPGHGGAVHGVGVTRRAVYEIGPNFCADGPHRASSI
mmetsp:Transcript_54159/g.100021  ORF Transcript_54159/g.100021 Transcript_54159/m.100021 type:complete len:420 (+) Transcript_54159:29-1288(+)